MAPSRGVCAGRGGGSSQGFGRQRRIRRGRGKLGLVPDLTKLDYRAEPKVGRRRWTLALSIALLVIAVIIYLLFELQRAPYRPPQDMSTFLGGEEIAFVRMVIGYLAIAWCGCAVALAWLLWRRKRHS